jgi:hypothetical protein
MQNFLSLKAYIKLNESLNVRQQNRVRSWLPSDQKWQVNDVEPSPNAINISKHIIPEGQHHIIIPATPHTMNSVKEHLENNGHTLHDYARGIARDKYGRDINIGKVLTKTGANKNLIDSYASDDRKSAVDMDNHEIVISRHPYHIAEGSTDKPWKSCAGLTATGLPCRYGGGVAARKLPDEIREGTHVAYLVPKTYGSSIQHKIDNAKARVYLKPYESKQSGHKILVPENKVYQKNQGEGKNVSFLNSLKDFTDKHFPMNSGETYHKNPKVYDDDLGSRSPKFNTSDDSINKILDSENGADVLLNHKNLHPNIVGKLIDAYKHHPQNLGRFISNRPLDSSHVNQLLNINDDRALYSALQNPHLLDHHKQELQRHIHNITDSKIDEFQNRNLVNNMVQLSDYHFGTSNISENGIHKIVDTLMKNYDNDNKRFSDHDIVDLGYHHNFNSSHIDKIIPKSSIGMDLNFMNSRVKDKFTNDQLKYLINKHRNYPYANSNPGIMAETELRRRQENRV